MAHCCGFRTRVCGGEIFSRFCDHQILWRGISCLSCVEIVECTLVNCPSGFARRGIRAAALSHGHGPIARQSKDNGILSRTPSIYYRSQNRKQSGFCGTGHNGAVGHDDSRSRMGFHSFVGLEDKRIAGHLDKLRQERFAYLIRGEVHRLTTLAVNGPLSTNNRNSTTRIDLTEFKIMLLRILRS